jgi:K+-transporting ATPase KdpF subunit
MFRQDGVPAASWDLRSKGPWHSGSVERVHGGPMTVVAGIVALLLLGYLVVALVQPERF